MNNPKPRCALCGASGGELVQKGVRHDSTVEIHRCITCGLVSLFPTPTPADLDEYYSGAYRNDYQEPPIAERYRADLDEAGLRVGRLAPMLHTGCRLLEIGCGSGAFLKHVQTHVAEVAGVEPEDKARNWISSQLRLPVVARLENVNRGDLFDVVVLFHVLEHIPNPIEFLRGLGRVLRPGGRLVIEVPSVDDALVSLYKVPAYLKFYYQKAHLFYFSKQTLADALSRAGFDAEVAGLQRYDISNHIRWMLTGEPGGKGYYSDVFQSALMATYADSLVDNGFADTLWAVGTRASE